jgi:hypothetical protein
MLVPGGCAPHILKVTAMENLPTDTSCRNAAIARWDDEGGATLTESGRQSRSIPQPGYRIVTKAVVRYGVEVSEPNKPPRVVLTCSTEAAADLDCRVEASLGSQKAI